MIDIKASLSIELQGGVMQSKDECLKTTRKVWKDKNGKTHSKKVTEEDWDKMDSHYFFTDGDKKKGIKPEKIVYHTRKCIPAKQHINISREAYESMVDYNDCPEWSKLFIWKKMTKDQRLKAHMERIAEGLGGKMLEYHVFED